MRRDGDDQRTQGPRVGTEGLTLGVAIAATSFVTKPWQAFAVGVANQPACDDCRTERLTFVETGHGGARTEPLREPRQAAT